MSYSADCEFLQSDCSFSSYQRWRDDHSGEVIHKILIGKPAEKPRLSAIIHEINECEISNLLYMWGYEDDFITCSKDVIARNKWIFTINGHISINEEIWISHIISPYGCCGCAMPRRNFRVRW